MPFLHDLTPTGGHSAAGKTFDTLPNHISNNFIFANYGSSEGIDNDDGSSSYYIDSNVFYWADGFKVSSPLGFLALSLSLSLFLSLPRHPLTAPSLPPPPPPLRWIMGDTTRNSQTM